MVGNFFAQTFINVLDKKYQVRKNKESYMSKVHYNYMDF